jgi:hypothetical protein
MDGVTKGLVCDVPDEASADLSSQVNERRENHKKVLEDLDTILDQVSLVWQRIGKVYCIHGYCVYMVTY